MRKKNYIKLLIFFCLLQSCVDEKHDFQKAYSQLPEIPLPLKIHIPDGAYFTPNLNAIKNNVILQKTGYGDYASLFGRLYDHTNYKAVLINLPTDVGTPVIFTFNNNGSKIDSVELFDARPATTIGLISKETVFINPDGTIEFTDSSTYIDDDDKPLRLEINKKIITIDQTGHFQINKQ